MLACWKVLVVAGPTNSQIHDELLALYQAHATVADWEGLRERLRPVSHGTLPTTKLRVEDFLKSARSAQETKAAAEAADQQLLNRRLTGLLVAAAQNAPEAKTSAQRQQGQAMQERRRAIQAARQATTPWWNIDSPGKAWFAFVLLLYLVGVFQILQLFRRKRRLFSDS